MGNPFFKSTGLRLLALEVFAISALIMSKFAEHRFLAVLQVSKYA